MSELTSGVQLLDNKSASAILYALLSDAIKAFPSELVIDTWPVNLAAFRKGYVTLLPEFEAARLACSRRHEIAQYLANAMQQQLIWMSA
ncbi:MAG: hypothetical protein ACI82A_004084, partial [Candidatus Azotimanducaceae bacterium]